MIIYGNYKQPKAIQHDTNKAIARKAEKGSNAKAKNTLKSYLSSYFMFCPQNVIIHQ